MSSKIVLVNDGNFQTEVLNSNATVLVDLYATWCGPCKMLTPIMEELANDLDGQVKICKLDVDESPQIAGQYKVMSVPTIMVFRNGELLAQESGANGKLHYLSLLKSL